MDSNFETKQSLEQLLESLIKMVGKTNENLAGLNRRVHQLEWYLQETRLEPTETRRFLVVSGQSSTNHR